MPYIQEIYEQLKAFKRKYYLNKALEGGLLWLAFTLGLFLSLNTLEFGARMNELGRAILFFFFIGALLGTFYLLVFQHLYKVLTGSKQISNEMVAKEIGRFFPEISDKLLNVLQLNELTAGQNALIQASIEQKSKEINHLSFEEAIDYSKNRKYIKYVAAPLLAIVLVLIFIPKLITDSSKRILNFNQAYLPEAPFAFSLENEELLAFKNESFKLNIRTVGKAIPEEVFLVTNGRKIKAKKEIDGGFTYTFNSLNKDVTFQFEASSVVSPLYELKVVDRPSISSFKIFLDYPKHTKREDESIQNTGNLKVPEGTNVKWQLSTKSTDEAKIRFDSSSYVFDKQGVEYYYDSVFKKPTIYSLSLQNEYSQNKDSLTFEIEVIRDQYPNITLEQYQDTVLYREIVLAGQITDDYGLSQLSLKYAFEGSEVFKRKEILINKELNEQSYYHVFKLDSSYVKAGGEIKYYLEVSDNDRLNGYKRRKTSTYSFKIPSQEEIELEIEKGNQQVQQEINNSINEAKELQQSIEALDERLKTKKELDWEDEKLMQDILDQKEKLSEKLQELKEENRKNNNKQEQFSEQSDDIKRKMDQLQEIMDNVLDDDTKKLYDELRELLEEQSDIEEFREKTEELRDNSKNLEEDLERTLELFKKLQYDMKLEDNIQQLEKEIEDQEALQKETENGEKTNEELAKEQQQEQEDLSKFKEEMEKLNELNQERKNPDPLPKDLNEEIEDIQKEQQEAQEALEEDSKKEKPEGEQSGGKENQGEEGKEENGEQEEQEQKQEEKGEEQEEEQEEEQQEGEQEQRESKPQEQNAKASKAQQRAAQKMQEMKESLESMQSGAAMEQQMEDLDNLRALVDNLVTLSFNQEDLMNEFKDIRQSDPRFVSLSQEQLKLKDDSQVIQDSLVSLSQRVFQISSFVMKELGEMNRQMDGSVDALKEKNVGQAIGKQQFTMTSINNLALLLDDILQQMQNQMASAMGKGQKSKGQKNMPMGSISDLQKQLSEQIKELKQSGKSGRALSEELAKMAGQQERIRNALENFETGLEGNKLGDKIDRLIEQMEENELDLLNKNISEETVERQRDILTRMLDAENAMQQRGEEEKREAQTAYDYELSVPESMLEYLKQKEKEVALMRTIPAKLNPYYKKETNKYFNKLKKKD